MTEYKLYLESGPKMKTTMVHVFDLLGCIANGPTTEEALDATPDAIRRFLAMLKRHGERVYPNRRLHDVDRGARDRGLVHRPGQPARRLQAGLRAADPRRTRGARPTTGLARRRARDDYAGKLSAKQLTAKPAKGRPLGEIFRHVIATQQEYVRVAGLTKTDEMKQIAKEADSRSDDPKWLADALRRMFRARQRGVLRGDRRGPGARDPARPVACTR